MNRLFAASIETNRHHPYEATTFSGNWDCQRATSFLHADVFFPTGTDINQGTN